MKISSWASKSKFRKVLVKLNMSIGQPLCAEIERMVLIDVSFATGTYVL